jgi:hypothetical protein
MQRLPLQLLVVLEVTEASGGGSRVTGALLANTLKFVYADHCHVFVVL